MSMSDGVLLVPCGSAVLGDSSRHRPRRFWRRWVTAESDGFFSWRHHQSSCCRRSSRCDAARHEGSASAAGGLPARAEVKGHSREFKFYSDFIYLHISMGRIYAFHLFKRWFKNMAKWCRKTVKQILQIRDRKQKPEGGRGEDSRTSGWKTNPAGGKSWRETKSKKWTDAAYHQDSLINLAVKMPRQQIGAEDGCLQGQAGDRMTPSTWQ